MILLTNLYPNDSFKQDSIGVELTRELFGQIFVEVGVHIFRKAAANERHMRCFKRRILIWQLKMNFKLKLLIVTSYLKEFFFLVIFSFIFLLEDSSSK